jgi:hypothetical protein
LKNFSASGSVAISCALRSGEYFVSCSFASAVSFSGSAPVLILAAFVVSIIANNANTTSSFFFFFTCYY